MPVIKNQKGGRAVVRVVNGSETLTIAGNSSVSNVATTSEVVTGATIGRIFWTGACTIARGSNTVFSSLVNTSGTWDLSGSGMAFVDYDAATLAITAAAATVVVEITKSPQSGGA